jgi:hypothetical protein
MFDSNSRYFPVPTSTLSSVDGDGRTRLISYKLRRHLPAPGGAPTLVEHIVRQGERLDNVTARYLVDPTQFWQVCDANVVIQPEDLTRRPGRIIRIPLPGIR